MSDYTISRIKLQLEGNRKLQPEELTKIVRKIKLNTGETGFVKVLYRYYEKLPGLGEDKFEDLRYERPAKNIPDGAYCEFCNDGEGKLGGDTVRHEIDCENPQTNSLLSTVGLFKNIMIDSEASVNRTKIDPELLSLVKRWKSGKLTENDIEDTFNFGVKIKNGKVKVINSNAPTSVNYRSVKPLSGIETAKSELQNDWKNNACFYYVDKEGQKTQFRLDRKGNIMVLHLPWETYKNEKELFKDLESRIAKVIPDYKIKANPIILDLTASKKITEGQIDIRELVAELFPKKSNFKYDSAPHIKAVYIEDGKAAKLTFIGSELANGKSYNLQLERYPKIGKLDSKITINILHEELKYTVEVFKSGTFRCIVSRNDKTSKNTSVISERAVKPVFQTIISILEEKVVELNPKFTVTKIDTTTKGTPLPERKGTKTNVCRGAKPGKPSPKPEPYSFRGKCPEPGQVVLPLEGYEGKDGLWYPCCGKLTKTGDKSQAKYRKLLVEGFPGKQGEAPGGVPMTPDAADKLSGVLPKNFDKPGTKLKIKDGTIVKMITPLKNGKFTVSTTDNKQAVIERKEIIPESRHLVGMRSILEQRKESLVNSYGKEKGDQLYNEYLCSLYSSVGKMCPGGSTDGISRMEANVGDFRPAFMYLTFVEIERLLKSRYSVMSVPKRASIVGISEGKAAGEAIIVDLETGEMKTVTGWKSIKGQHIGHSYTSKDKTIIKVWKHEEGTSVGTHKDYTIIKVRNTSGELEKDVVSFCKNTNLDANGLVFVPEKESKYTLVWKPEPQGSKPYLVVQLVGRPLVSNRQSITWNVGIQDETLRKGVLKKRDKLTITIKKLEVDNLNIDDGSYVLVKPMYDNNGKLNNTNPFSLVKPVLGPGLTKHFYNTISMLVNAIPSRILKPVKHKGVYAWYIDSDYIVYDENRLKLLSE